MKTRETSRSACGSRDLGRAGRTARFGVLLLLLAQPALASSEIDCAVEGACCFPRSAPRIAQVPEPRLAKISAITGLAGSLPKPAVKRVLGERTAALGACAGGKGEVRAHLVVAPSGAAQISRVVATPQVGRLADAAPLARCVTEALRATSFPKASGVTELDVRITW